MSGILSVSFRSLTVPDDAMSKVKTIQGIILISMSEEKDELLTVTCAPENSRDVAMKLAQLFPGEQVAW